MDRHFREAPLERNMPALMALIGLWYIDFWGAAALAVLPYAQDLARFPAYLQQLEMESNGKSVARDGGALAVATAPVSHLDRFDSIGRPMRRRQALAPRRHGGVSPGRAT